MSSRAWLVDEIHSIGEKAALCDHLEEIIGEDARTEEVLKKTLELRRKQMQEVADESDNSNPKFWCAFKHAAKAFTLDSEVYEATLSGSAKENMIESANILASLISLFLGMDFEVCARCVYDRLLLNQVAAKNQEEDDNGRVENENSDRGGSQLGEVE